MTTVDTELALLLAASRNADTTQLQVAHRGRPLASYNANGEALSTASVTKLLVGVTIGRAVRLGLLLLDDPVSRWFPQWSTDRRATITVRHVMGHASGLAADTWLQLDAAPPADLLAYVVDELAVVAEPGTVYAYNNAAVMVLPAIVARVAGIDFLEFARVEVFDPLGIVNWSWRRDEAGNPLGMATAALNAEGLAKVGQLLAQDGRWNDRQLLESGWVVECRQPSLGEVRGAGLLLMDRWADAAGSGEPVAFGHDGDGGQHLWIYPGSGLVIARLRDNRRSDGPGFERGTSEQQFTELPGLGAELDVVLRSQS